MEKKVLIVLAVFGLASGVSFAENSFMGKDDVNLKVKNEASVSDRNNALLTKTAGDALLNSNTLNNGAQWRPAIMVVGDGAGPIVASASAAPAITGATPQPLASTLSGSTAPGVTTGSGTIVGGVGGPCTTKTGCP